MITLREKSSTIFGGINLVNMNTTRHRHITRRPVGGTDFFTELDSELPLSIIEL